MGALCCTSLKTENRNGSTTCGIGRSGFTKAAANVSEKGYKEKVSAHPTPHHHITLCDAIFDSVAFMCPCAKEDNDNEAHRKVELNCMRTTWTNTHDNLHTRAGTETPRTHRPLSIVTHEMLPCTDAFSSNDNLEDAFARPHTWPKKRPHTHAQNNIQAQLSLSRPPPLCNKNIFINIDRIDDVQACNSINNTPSKSNVLAEDDNEEWHTPRTFSSASDWASPRANDATYCRVRRDSNENTFTFMVNSSVVKDVYINYELMRSPSL